MKRDFDQQIYKLEGKTGTVIAEQVEPMEQIDKINASMAAFGGAPLIPVVEVKSE
jgi:hypothetical protein